MEIEQGPSTIGTNQTFLDCEWTPVGLNGVIEIILLHLIEVGQLIVID